MGILEQDYCENGNFFKFVWNLDGKRYRSGTSTCWQETRIVLVGIRWRHHDDWEKAEYHTHAEKLMKNVDLDEPTSFFHHVYLGRPQRECKPNATTKCLNHIFLKEQKPPGWEQKPHTKTIVWWKDTPKSVWQDTANWQPRKLSHHTKFQVLASMIISSTKKNLNQWEKYHKYAHIVLNCLYLARIGRPDILWTINKPARSVAKWTQACDNRLARLMSYFHHTNNYRQYCDVGNTAQHCRVGLFQDSDIAGDFGGLEINLRGGVLCTFGSQTFVPVSWMCKKPTSVSHSSRESEIIQLDAGLRMDGLIALDLWYIKKLKCYVPQTQTALQETENRKWEVEQLSNVVYVLTHTHTHSSQTESQLYIFDDNESVIKMIIKGQKSYDEARVQYPQSCS